MEISERNRQVYFNGEIVPESEARISIYDSALMFGDMVFEMTRSFNKKQFLLEEHIDRLFNGLKILEIDPKLTKSELIEICHKVQNINDHLFDSDDEHRLMINISRGPLGIYGGRVKGLKKEPTIIVADFPLKWTLTGMSRFYKDGINCVIPSQRAIPATLMDPKIKNRSRMWYQMANIEVSKFEGDNNWALLIDPDGFITEGTGNNFFMIKDGDIISPQPRNILRGTRRKYIFHLAKQLGINCYEKNIEPYDIYSADEAFITGTPFCILPVTSFRHQEIGNGNFGDISKALLEQWSLNVGLDIKQQIINYDSTQEKLTSSTPYKHIK
tara:strand:+ start:35 stop:1018 length:984 start_codon:yes stop_codon:yes gene_type:complete